MLYLILTQDMMVNILDAIVLVNVVLGQEDSANADLNGDGVVNILDVVQMVNLILGKPKILQTATYFNPQA